MARPVWLLDFDGVVNAISRKGDRSVWDDWRSTSITVPDPDGGTAYPILWSPTVVGAIRYAVDRGVDVRWLSTWREHSALFVDAIAGMPSLPWLGDAADDPAGNRGHQWKVAAADAYMDPAAPLLWTDDMHDMFIDSSTLARLLSRPGGTTLVTPVETIGLSKKNLRAVREWVDIYTPGSGI